MTTTDSLASHLVPAVECLMAARRGGRRPDALPEGARPKDWAEVYAILDTVQRKLGSVAAWKVGAPSPDAEPARAAITAATLHEGPARLSAPSFNVIGMEAELAYRFATPLPPRDEPYTEAEVAAAIASIHPAIEIIDTRYAAWGVVDKLSAAADQMSHGALIVGPGLADWRRVRPLEQPVSLRIDGRAPFETVGGNSAGDPMRMLVWMANTGASAFGGLQAGTIVTTGSTTGTIFIEPGRRTVASFPGVGEVEVIVE